MILLLLAGGCTQNWLPPLEVGEPIPSDFGDVILVLGGGLRPRVTLGFSTEERLKLAVRLYNRRPRAIIVSDGSLYARSPAIPRIREWLTSRGVKPRHIIFEGRSQNTRENLVNGLAIIRRRGFIQVIVCTSPYHQARVRLLMQHMGFPAFRIARMDTSEIRSASGLGRWVRNVRLIMREYLAILRFYLLEN